MLPRPPQKVHMLEHLPQRNDNIDKSAAGATSCSMGVKERSFTADESHFDADRRRSFCRNAAPNTSAKTAAENHDPRVDRRLTVFVETWRSQNGE